jgi:hypothetical protein
LGRREIVVVALPDIAELQQRVRFMASRIGASDRELPIFGSSQYDDGPHVEVSPQGMHYVVFERGQELERITTRDTDELLWHVFKHVTSWLASSFELAHRLPGQDFRRVMFAKQVELLQALSPAWARRESAEHERILANHPFDDRSDDRVRLTVALRGSGLSDDEAWRIACGKYPLPKPG